MSTKPWELQNWCRTAGVGSREFLNFSRALRATYHHERNPSVHPEDLLDIVDHRTLVKFAVTSGGVGDRIPPSVDEFLTRQRFIGKEMMVAAVRVALHVPERTPATLVNASAARIRRAIG